MNFSFCLIARNESKTLPRLLKSLDEFKARGGKVYILDTGSTDNTAEIARKWGAEVHEVGDKFLIKVDEELSKKINEKYVVDGELEVIKEGDRQFDYSSARNYIAEFSETDFIFTPDCDEIFTSFNIDVISGLIDEGVQQLEYNFVFSHLPDGSPAIQFLHSKAYNRTCLKWVGVIHEVLQGDAKRQYVYEDVIKLEHFQNPETNRSHYLRGLAIDTYLNPENDRNSHYFGRELMFTNRYRSAIRELKRHLTLGKMPMENAQSMIFIGRCYGFLNMPDKQVDYYNQSIYTDGSRREPYIEFANFYLHNNRFLQAVAYAKAALEIPYNNYYANNMSHYTDEPHRILYVAYGFMGIIDEAKEHLNKCLEYQPNNSDYLRDFRFYNGLPTISVIIPHVVGYRDEGLDKCLASIIKQNYPQELISIHTIEGEETVPEKVKIGVQESNGYFICFAASDVIFDKDDFIKAVIKSQKVGYELLIFNTGVPECEHFMIKRSAIDSLSNKEIFDTRFHHVGCDNWLWHQMRSKGLAAIVENTKTIHNHFSRGGQMDALYERGWYKAKEDRELLDNLINGNINN
jgi:glycosyltransferase involved in cell wall biosynthesis